MTTATDLAKVFKNIDFGKLDKAVVWALNAPRCLDEPCFQRWLAWGKKLLGARNKFYIEKVKKERFHRQQMRMARQLVRSR